MDIMMQACAFASAGEEAKRIGVVYIRPKVALETERSVRYKYSCGPAVSEWVMLIWRRWMDGNALL